MRNRLVQAACLTALLASCSGSQEPLDITRTSRPSGNLLPVNREILALRPAPNPDRNAYFGDLHVHTGYSFDAYVFGNTTLPADAYRYAKGEALQHPSGFEMQLQQPLDFYAVTDHAMFMGLIREAADTSTRFSRYEVSKPLHNINAWYNMHDLSLIARGRNFAGFLTNSINELLDGTIDPKVVEAVTRSAWLDTIQAADNAYEPGKFTTFAAFEYTSSTDDMGNLHRNVIFKATDRLPAMPFSRFNSQNPEGLWDWMDSLRGDGIESLAIPHNSNGSNGQMFKLVDWAGDPMDDDYSIQRMRNEPLVEITQVKGTSDTHPLLSKNDEWADFEIAPYRVATKLDSEVTGSYVRDAYLRGLQLAAGGVVNPYKFGLVGASDTHNSASSPDEANYFSKVRHARRHGRIARLDSRVLRLGHPPAMARAGAGTGSGRQAVHERRGFPVLVRLGPNRRVGRGEHPGVDLPGLPPQGDLCHQRPPHEGALFRRLRIRAGPDGQP